MFRFRAFALCLTAFSCLSLWGRDLPVGAPPESDQLEQLLLTHTEKLLGRLKQVGVRNVGVLKFAIRSEQQEKFPGSKGHLNRRLTEKTEVAAHFAAIALGQADRRNRGAQRPVDLIVNATETAAKIPGASHLGDRKARDRLFSGEYRRGWLGPHGEKTTKADAFIFGVAEIDKDLRKVTVQLSALVRSDLQHKDDPPILESAHFEAPLSVEDLLASGEGYVIVRGDNRAGKDDRAHRRDQAFGGARKGRQLADQLHPLKSPHRPINLEVCYDGTPQVPFFRNAGTANEPGAYLPEPREQQAVTMVIRRRDPKDNTRYGVLLRVNGVNTLLNQRLPDHRCALWILEPGRQSIAVEGIHTAIGDEGKRMPFRVTGAKESLELETFYGSNLGMISVTVFDEAKLGELLQQKAADIKNIRLKTVKKATPPVKPTPDRSRFGKSLTDQLLAQNVSRGAIHVDEKKKEKAVTKLTTFKRASVPIFAASLRYYEPTSVDQPAP